MEGDVSCAGAGNGRREGSGVNVEVAVEGERGKHVGRSRSAKGQLGARGDRDILQRRRRAGSLRKRTRAGRAGDGEVIGRIGGGARHIKDGVPSDVDAADLTEAAGVE